MICIFRHLGELGGHQCDEEVDEYHIKEAEDDHVEHPYLSDLAVIAPVRLDVDEERTHNKPSQLKRSRIAEASVKGRRQTPSC